MLNLSRPSIYAVFISLIFSLMTAPLQAQTNDVVDLMVLYSGAAAQDRNGNIETYINSLVDSSNTTYQSSNMKVRVRLVHTEQYEVAGINAIDSSALNALRSNARVNQLRAEHGADLVAYLEYAPRSSSGGFVCGIGYVGSGSNGQLASYAKNYAFSITGSNCGSTSFTHELGHNMGLGHSRKQGSSGGVFDYGLGYGVDNVVATTMAYDFLFNARRVERFSNPNQTCAGVTCGVNRSRSDGADAVFSVNAISAQIANYLPSKDGGGSNNPEADPVKNVPTITNNLISNASAENGLSPWVQRYNATLSQNSIRRFTGEKSLEISNRQYNYSGVSQDLLGKMVDGGKYKINANLRLAGNGSDVATMVIGVNDAQGFRFEYFDRIGITSDQWTAINEEFTLETTGAIKELFIHFYGPKAENSFYLDQVSITPLGGNGGGNQPEPQPNPNIVLNGDLEAGSLTQWQSAYSGTINLSTQTRHSGSFSMYTLNRRNWYDGPMQRVTTRIESGNTYELSAWVGLGDTSTQPLSARLFYRDNSGSRWLTIAATNVTNRWSELKGSINLQANGPITEARLHFFGPTSSSNFFVDDVQLVKK